MEQPERPELIKALFWIVLTASTIGIIFTIKSLLYEYSEMDFNETFTAFGKLLIQVSTIVAATFIWKGKAIGRLAFLWITPLGMVISLMVSHILFDIISIGGFALYMLLTMFLLIKPVKSYFKLNGDYYNEISQIKLGEITNGLTNLTRTSSVVLALISAGILNSFGIMIVFMYKQGLLVLAVNFLILLFAILLLFFAVRFWGKHLWLNFLSVYFLPTILFSSTLAFQLSNSQFKSMFESNPNFNSESMADFSSGALLLAASCGSIFLAIQLFRLNSIQKIITSWCKP